MKTHKKHLIFLLFLLFLFPTVAHASDDVDISQIPAKLAEKLNIPLIAGQIMASSIILALLLFPTLILTKKIMAHLFMGLVAMGLCISLGWLPYYFLLLLAFIVAVLWSNQIKNWITG